MKNSKTMYSKFNKEFFDQIKKANLFSISNQVTANKDPEGMRYLLFMESFTQNYENIFIETEELYNFLKDTKIITNGDICSQLYTAIENRNHRNISENKTDYNNETIKFRCYSFMLYGPINVINTALAVNLYVSDKEIDHLEKNEKARSHSFVLNSLCWSGKLDYGWKYAILSDKAFSEIAKKNDSKTDVDIHVIINMLFYMNAFPDCVYEGVPKRAILPSEISSKKRVTLTPNVDFFEKLTQSPHLRRGHFRTYSSNYYKNMKGKTVWINPVFVKGNAITVNDDGINNSANIH